MKILVVGKGGREHALAWKLAQSNKVEKIYAAPGNAGMLTVAECVNIASEDLLSLAEFAKNNVVDLTVVGPELPLTMGIVDIFEEKGLKIFGPTKEAAKIEGSKSFAKNFMQKYHIPTASFKVFSDPSEAMSFISSARYPLVVKADGLASGKGAAVVNNPAEGKAVVEEMMIQRVFGEAGDRLVVEDFLEGEEVTVMAFTDGERVIPTLSVQDHKRIYDGDRGPNTGGMGAYAPTTIVSDKMMKRIVEEILEPTIRGLAEQGQRYKGVLYTGLMLTERGPKVLEFNCRFGDPETQAVLPLLEGDLCQILMDIAGGYLSAEEIKWKDLYSVCVVIASKGYPASYEKGVVIEGLDNFKAQDAFVFHAGTARVDGRYVTNGGRILGVAATDPAMKGALKKAYDAVGMINFDGMQYRRDIGWRAGRVDTSYF